MDRPSSRGTLDNTQCLETRANSPGVMCVDKPSNQYRCWEPANKLCRNVNTTRTSERQQGRSKHFSCSFFVTNQKPTARKESPHETRKSTHNQSAFVTRKGQTITSPLERQRQSLVSLVLSWTLPQKNTSLSQMTTRTHQIVFVSDIQRATNFWECPCFNEKQIGWKCFVWGLACERQMNWHLTSHKSPTLPHGPNTMSSVRSLITSKYFHWP